MPETTLDATALRLYVLAHGGEVAHLIFASSSDEAWRFVLADDPLYYTLLRERGTMLEYPIRAGLTGRERSRPELSARSPHTSACRRPASSIRVR